MTLTRVYFNLSYATVWLFVNDESELSQKNYFTFC